MENENGFFTPGVFSKLNKALSVGCLKGYPVVKRRSFCLRTSRRRACTELRDAGKRLVFKCAYYLFVRCDNEPVPWTKCLHDNVGFAKTYCNVRFAVMSSFHQVNK
ncbi:hypothetical protein SELMODRAFT_418840 [Selaginella moellendorffii]|uniref:Uncharacterized protein n=1 Tax=Selaginella moellendorffii TaxID=88036 RepID=D8S6J6_SELML|nr:hypothetical protein SELMODRAFT_418840 [Selaginella moellendorffii]